MNIPSKREINQSIRQTLEKNRSTMESNATNRANAVLNAISPSVASHVPDAVNALRDIYASRVSKGTTDSGAKYARYENGDKDAGVYSSPDFSSAYYNNDNGTSAFARKVGGNHNTYVAGLSNPNWNIPDGSHGINTPLGYFEVGSGEGDDGQTGYLSWESPIEKYSAVLPNGDRQDNISYSPVNGSYLYANRENYANGDSWYNAGVQSPLFNGNGYWDERDTPIGTFGAGYGGGGAGMSYSPNETVAKFLQMLSTLRR